MNEGLVTRSKSPTPTRARLVRGSGGQGFFGVLGLGLGV